MNRFFYYEVKPQNSNTLFDQIYQTGTILTYDSESETEKPVMIGKYNVPIEAANQFQDFVESLETEFPLFVSFGTEQLCKQEAAKELMVPVAQLTSKADSYIEEDNYQSTSTKKSTRKVRDEEDY